MKYVNTELLLKEIERKFDGKVTIYERNHYWFVSWVGGQTSSADRVRLVKNGLGFCIELTERMNRRGITATYIERKTSEEDVIRLRESINTCAITDIIQWLEEEQDGKI